MALNFMDQVVSDPRKLHRYWGNRHPGNTGAQNVPQLDFESLTPTKGATYMTGDSEERWEFGKQVFPGPCPFLQHFFLLKVHLACSFKDSQ